MLSRPTWSDTWLEVAAVVAKRSLCSRAKVGAVIVDATNRVVATGYNGPPAGFVHSDLSCDKWCPRGMGQTDISVQTHDDCPALHAEANALSVCERRVREGGTIYVTGDVCRNCAKLIANSGLKTVVVRPDDVDRAYRRSKESYDFLVRCGLTVVSRDRVPA